MIYQDDENNSEDSISTTILSKNYINTELPATFSDNEFIESVPNQENNENNPQVDFNLLKDKLIPTSILSEEIAKNIFQDYHYFNQIQSDVFQKIYHTDSSLVICAPTGCGKTVILELAIVRLYEQYSATNKLSQLKIVYVAPLKALCNEKYEDWYVKFSRIGLSCLQLTGDSPNEDIYKFKSSHIILTTPEKWDSVTRMWKDNMAQISAVRLFLLDEIHALSDKTRGPTLEAIVSRMKTIQNELGYSIRFVALSASIPNVEDLASWLSCKKSTCIPLKYGEELRPVKLKIVVMGYPCDNKTSGYRFDMLLSYKLNGLIQTYSNGKPTLIFCSTRKGVLQSALTIAKSFKYVVANSDEQRMHFIGSGLKDVKLRDLFFSGIGYHHAGMETTDRRNIESAFLRGELPILFCTSTLSQGINLPAHLVIIKSTEHYENGSLVEYTRSEVLQMIGRAGRPQFDSSATAIIMTQLSKKHLYERVVGGAESVESGFHFDFTSHLNAEIVLNTVRNQETALSWLRSTYLFIRLQKNPSLYGVPKNFDGNFDDLLTKMMKRNIDALLGIELIKINDKIWISTTLGKHMARFCISYTTMRTFFKLSGKESLYDLIYLISGCEEFNDLLLRSNEKRILNSLNHSKNSIVVRFPLKRKIRTLQDKVMTLIQSVFSSIPIQDFSLQSDINKIFKVLPRMARCLSEMAYEVNLFNFSVVTNTFAKCVKCRLWENSKYVSRQLERVGPAIATLLVNRNYTTFSALRQAHPRQIELAANRHPPFGDVIKSAIEIIPEFSLLITQENPLHMNQATLNIDINLKNKNAIVSRSKDTNGYFLLIVGNSVNDIFYQSKCTLHQILTSNHQHRVPISRSTNSETNLDIRLISLQIVGIDVACTFTPHYLSEKRELSHVPQLSNKKIAQTCEISQFKRISGVPVKKRKLSSVACESDLNACALLEFDSSFDEEPVEHTNAIDTESLVKSSLKPKVSNVSNLNKKPLRKPVSKQTTLNYFKTSSKLSITEYEKSHLVNSPHAECTITSTSESVSFVETNSNKLNVTLSQTPIVMPQPKFNNQEKNSKEIVNFSSNSCSFKSIAKNSIVLPENSSPARNANELSFSQKIQLFFH